MKTNIEGRNIGLEEASNALNTNPEKKMPVYLFSVLLSLSFFLFSQYGIFFSCSRLKNPIIFGRTLFPHGSLYFSANLSTLGGAGMEHIVFHVP